MKMRWTLVGLGLTAYGVVANYADPFLLFLVMVWIGTPTIIVSSVVLGCVAIRRRSIRAVAVPFWPAVAGVILVLGMLPLNERLQEWAVDNAKAYPGRVAALLEQHRQQHGRYPASLDELPSHPFRPRLLRTTYSYGTNGVRYWFSFPVPGGMIDEWNYSSEDQTWHLST